ncbi:putative amidoligase enzyme [compost metagenome]
MAVTVRKFGVEIEGYTDGYVDSISVNGEYWEAKGDGSLDQDFEMYGREVVSPPIYDTSQIEEAYRVLKGDHGWHINGYKDRSRRSDAGLHIHVDAGDYGELDVYKMMTLIMAVEPIIYSLTHESRPSNCYSQSMLSYSSDVRRVLRKGEPETNVLSRRFEYIPNGNRSGLNLNALSGHGSIEFRYFYPQMEAEKVIQYVEIVTRLVDFVKAASSDQIHLLARAIIEASSFDKACEILEETIALPFNLAALKENDYYERWANQYSSILLEMPALQQAQ